MSPFALRALPWLALPLSALAMSALAAAAPAQPPTRSPRRTPAVLSLPEPGLDDSAAYQGYRTRFYRDAAGNTLQIYLDQRDGRVVHLWADAENESLGLTVRDTAGRPAPLRWTGDSATVGIAMVGTAGRSRWLRYSLASDAPALRLGWFLLGSMRVERDFQYAGRQDSAFTAPPFTVAETDRLVAALGRVDAATRRRHLALLHAPTVAALQARLAPRATLRRDGADWLARLVQPSLDARDTITLEIRADARRVAASADARTVTLAARGAGRGVPFTVRVATTGRALTPLARREIFTPAFLAFLDRARADSAGGSSLRGRLLERQVRGVELLASREKLMAGLPTYATYFGRDMMVSALMMRSVWRGAMSEAVIGSVLRKLAPDGEVSHEEALGGQAVREAAAEYASLVDSALARGGAPVPARADTVLRELRRTRENYHMIDDEYQLPVLAARWLADPDVPAAHKRAFLLEDPDGRGTRAARLVQELALVAKATAPYVAAPTTANLLSFAPRDATRWASASWRDSGAGYANGRYAMDVNAIWAPHALEATGEILASLASLGIRPDSLAAARPALVAGSPLLDWARDPARLRHAVDVWRAADRHFLVTLSPAEVRTRVAARLAAMPAAERDYWTRRLAAAPADTASVTFLALALDGSGRPIPVANSDPGTRLFLGDPGRRPGADAAADAAAREAVLRDVRLFARDYPVGLLVDQVGPVVANDAYATAPVWDAFAKDAYHGPRVVWGREVNLFLLGAASRLGEPGATDAAGAASGDAYATELRSAIARVRGAVEASGFRSELWSYDFVGGRPTAIRYGSGSDLQLWSTTDLAVQFALSRLAAPR